MTKVTILIDNQPSTTNPCLNHEHGLSIFIQTHDWSILCDTGLTGAFIDNASTMGINLNDTDFAFISHGHNDHTGGLPRLLDINNNLKVYASSHIFNRFSSSRLGHSRDISAPMSLLPLSHRFTFIDHSQWITPTIAIVECLHTIHQQPCGNQHLSNNGSIDNFNHELSLAIVENDSLIIVSSCSHSGALNIIDSCREFTGTSQVTAFIGGLHFTDGPHTNTEALQFTRDIDLHCPETTFYTGHCTCPRAQQILITHPNINIFTTGTAIKI